MIFLLPLWYHISDAARVALYRYQFEIYGLKLDIPPYPINTDPTDLVKEMSQRPHHPKGRGYKP